MSPVSAKALATFDTQTKVTYFILFKIEKFVLYLEMKDVPREKPPYLSCSLLSIFVIRLSWICNFGHIYFVFMFFLVVIAFVVDPMTLA